jgi:C-terminal processing protease CtpA/Prc
VTTILLAALLAATPSTLSADALREDIAVLEKTIGALHPGLERYEGVSLPRSVETLRRELAAGATPAEAYLALMRFTASLRCAHTHVNPSNQSKDLRAALLDGRDRVPFTFRILDGRMYVAENASGDARLAAGSEVSAIDGEDATRLLRGYLRYARGDGGNDAKRWRDLEVHGRSRHETFDLVRALSAPRGPSVRLRVRRPGTRAASELVVPAQTSAERSEALARSRGNPPRWAQRLLDERTAYIRLGTFATWSMEGDWKARLGEMFAAAAGKPALVLDLRGNEGGNDEVVAELARRLFAAPVSMESPREIVRYRRVDPELGRHLKSWSDDFRDLGDAVRALPDGRYERKPGGPVELPHSADAYAGRVAVLVDAANSSATFRLADVLRSTGRATLVGQSTGGNRRGINGGMVAFMTLPRSGIEVDLPLVGYFPLTPQPDEGVVPDVVVARTPAALAAGEDPELAAARALLR